MSHRIQLALTRQIERQIANTKRREHKQMMMSLRHRIEQIRLVDEHFEAREYDALQKVDVYYQKIKERIEINKARFDLCVDEKIEAIFADHHQPQLYTFDQNEFDETNERMSVRANDYLFFKQLYPSVSNPDDGNLGFYAVAFCCLMLEIARII
jgi:hypothetical protein